ncbi:MAG: hypothetical protein FD123_286 [Bacteroidetes bacterium]|nr:MAG: hypothetical protein FD123_286 [Bacteroidota bacterium]
MKFVFLVIFLLFITFFAQGQVVLSPSINTAQMPNGTDSICTFPAYIDTTAQFMLSGYHVGDLVPDFTLYNENGVSYNMETELQDGKPILLIAASYTCPQSRDGLTTILPTLLNTFGQQIKVFVIYEMEAHPKSPDVSPFSGGVWVTPNNYINGILYAQHQIYAGRQQMAHLADSALNISVPVLIDGPCNEWFSNYGPAPHNAYLVAPNGHIFRKYGWFNNTNYDIEADISLLLSVMGNNEPIAETPEVTVYPNPAAGTATLHVKGTANYALQVFDIAGKCILSRQTISEQQIPLEAGVFVPGVYVYAVTTAEGAVLRGRIIRR